MYDCELVCLRRAFSAILGSALAVPRVARSLLSPALPSLLGCENILSPNARESELKSKKLATLGLVIHGTYVHNF